ncbi:hypothetical protein [Streptomyces prunicolor]|uniref:Uncharacterized protein n=1 Tax=Streptomyces prunicolor TaxID=67348 RepID=A0ABU4F3I0_9ACTN|nr:hypothetical protein [Streptomyces prunicolor]MCX5235347.1 hypothetical protein [Streptomyces prunicolor]MDV7215148.1 hypothetical protein [Streptomyces prunicolor]
MTRQFGPDDHDQAAQHWLTRHQHALTNSLDDLLDTEAGLREILLHSHHDTATDNLDTVLDTEAGLAAILPGPQTPPADTYDATYPRTDTAELLHALSPADRMTLRNNADVKTASHALDRFLDAESALDLDLTRALARDLTRALTRALTRDIDLDLDLALARDVALDLALDLSRDLTREIAREIALALNHHLARAHARAHAHAHDRALDHDRAHSHAREIDIDIALARARDIARVLALDIDTAGARDLIVEIRTAEVGRAIGLALHREPLLVDKDSLHTLLHDFTATDLSNTDLTGIDLSGVRWSEHTTQWPPAIDIEDLKARSEETPSGTGTWIVRSGTATIRDHAER